MLRLPLSRILPTPLLLLTLCGKGPAQTAMPVPELVRLAGNALDPEARVTKRSQAVAVDRGQLQGLRVGDVRRLRLFSDVVFDARFESVEVEPNIPGTYHWIGSLAGFESSQFVITVHGRGFAAWIHPGDARFQSLAIQGDSGHLFARELDDAAHGCHGAPSLPDALRRGGSVGVQSACNDDPDRITVLLVYDNQARAKGETAVQAAILNALATASLALRNTNLSLRWLAAGTPLWINHNSTGTSRTDLDRLTYRKGPNDPVGYMDVVHNWRGSANADLVALVSGGFSGGVAWCGGASAANATAGFSVTGYASLGALTLAHEIGHNHGCAHDPLNVDCRPTTYGRGHNWLFEEIGFPTYARLYGYTLMSYSSKWGNCSFPYKCTKVRLPRFSSPLVKQEYKGRDFVTGTATRDNRRVLVARRQNVANYSFFLSGRLRAPTFRTQPQDANLCYGYLAPNTPVMSVDVDTRGNAATYQWRKGSTVIPGATSRVLTLGTDITAAVAGLYSCTVTTCAGTIRSQTARVRVDPGCRTTLTTYDKDVSGFGSVLASLPDIDGDGRRDYCVGHPKAKRGAAVDVGLFAIYTSSGNKFREFTGGTANMGFGSAMDGGYIDGDALGDVVVSAPLYDSGTGIIFVYSSQTKALTAAFVGPARNARAGTALTLAALDADTREDLVVVAGDTLHALANSRRTSGRWPTLWTATPVGGENIAAVAAIGDTNGDGIDEIVVGLPDHASGRGRWEVRSGRNGALLRAYNGSPGERIGAALAGIGDVDGDEVPDFVVGAPGKNSGKGLVLTVSGRTWQFLTYRFGTTNGRRLGYAVASAGGDVDDDGVPDVLVSEQGLGATTPGRVLVLSGKRLTTAITQRAGRSATFGVGVEGFDSNGDDQPDLLVGETDANGGKVWLFDALPRSNTPATMPYGASCQGSASRLPRLVITGSRRIDGAFAVNVTATPPSSATYLMLATARTDLGLDALGMTGCRLSVANSILGLIGNTNARGNGRFGFRLPNEPRLVGRKLTWQAVVFDGAANSSGLTTSHASELRIGAKL